MNPASRTALLVGAALTAGAGLFLFVKGWRAATTPTPAPTPIITPPITTQV